MRFFLPILAILAGASGGMAVAADWTQECGDARCTAATRLVTPDDKRLVATVAVSFGKVDGADPVLVIVTPLGMATQAGARLVVDGAHELRTRTEVCFPDGCQTLGDLTAADLARLSAAKSLSVQYFAYGREAPLSGEVGLDGLAGALTPPR